MQDDMPAGARTATGSGAGACQPPALPDSKHANTAQLCILTHRLKLTEDLPVVAVTEGQRAAVRNEQLQAYQQEADSVLAECLAAMGFGRADIASICCGGYGARRRRARPGVGCGCVSVGRPAGGVAGEACGSATASTFHVAWNWTLGSMQVRLAGGLPTLPAWNVALAAPVTALRRFILPAWPPTGCPPVRMRRAG